MGPALPGLDATVTQVESLPPGVSRDVQGGGALVHWVETIEGSANVTLRTQDDAPAMVSIGTLHYLGGWPDLALWDRVIGLLAAQSDLALTPLPEGLRLRDTATHRFAFNYAAQPIEWQDRTIDAADVAWWPHLT
jgi:beta-galactosidase